MRSTVARELLIVEDDLDIAEGLRIRLSAAGYEVRCAGESRAALAAVAERRPDLAILDLSLPGEDGVRIAERMREVCGEGSPPVIFLTASLRSELRDRALATPGARLVQKPYEARELLAAIEEACR